MKALLEIYRSVFSFWKIKGYYWWKHKLYRLCVRIPASVLLQISHKSEKITVTPQLSVMTSLSKFLDVVLFPLSGLVTGSSLMSISWLFLVLWQFFFLQRIDQKTGNGKYHCLSSFQIWRLGWVRDTKFRTNVSNKMLLNATKCQGYNFYCFWVIKGTLMQIWKSTNIFVFT